MPWVLDEEILHTEAVSVPATGPVRLVRTRITSVRVQDSALARIFQIVSQDFDHSFAKTDILHRKQDFNPLIQVAGHPIRAP
jgi:hypothetical protein